MSIPRRGLRSRCQRRQQSDCQTVRLSKKMRLSRRRKNGVRDATVSALDATRPDPMIKTEVWPGAGDPGKAKAL